MDTISVYKEDTSWTYYLVPEILLTDTTYEIILDTTVTDLFGIPVEQGLSFEFSTGK